MHSYPKSCGWDVPQRHHLRPGGCTGSLFQNRYKLRQQSHAQLLRCTFQSSIHLERVNPELCYKIQSQQGLLAFCNYQEKETIVSLKDSCNATKQRKQIQLHINVAIIGLGKSLLFLLR